MTTYSRDELTEKVLHALWERNTGMKWSDERSMIGEDIRDDVATALAAVLPEEIEVFEEWHFHTPGCPADCNVSKWTVWHGREVLERHHEPTKEELRELRARFFPDLLKTEND